jgi:hypothetical protein
VERRGVKGDRRLRLVTLTKRAFDLMSLMLEHAPLDAYGNLIGGLDRRVSGGDSRMRVDVARG